MLLVNKHNSINWCTKNINHNLGGHRLTQIKHTDQILASEKQKNICMQVICTCQNNTKNITQKLKCIIISHCIKLCQPESESYMTLI